MTKEEAIEVLEDILNEATADENSVCYVSSDDAEPLNMAIKALKRDDPKAEFQKHLEHCTIYGYPFKEVIVFADACRKNNISEGDMREFCLNAEAAWLYVIDKASEQIDIELKKRLS